MEEAADLRDEAQIHLALGDVDLARSKARAALDIHREIASPPETMRDLLLLVEIEAAAARFEDARAHLAEARRRVAPLNARLLRVESAVAEAGLFERAADPAGVLRVLDAIAGDLVAIGYGFEWQASLLRSRALARLGRTDEAVLAGEQAVDLVERVRAQLASPVQRTSFVSRRLEAYTHLVSLHIRSGNADAAFEVSDRARGRALLDHLGGAVAEDAGRLISIERELEILDRIEGLEESIIEFHRQSGGDPEVGSGAELYERLADARNDYEAAFARSGARGGGAPILGSAPASAEEVRAALEPGEVLLEYMVGEDATDLFVVDRAGVKAVRIGAGVDEIARLARVARDFLGDPSVTDAPPVLTRLFTLLLAPAVATGALDAANRLVIVPHGPLAYLPFAALLDERGRFVAERWASINLASASALPLLRSRAKSDVTPAFAVYAAAPLADRNDRRQGIIEGARCG